MGFVVIGQSSQSQNPQTLRSRATSFTKNQASSPSSPLFAPAVTYLSNPDEFTVSPVIVADVNGDGKLDVIAEGQSFCGNDCVSEGSIGVLPGNGDGTFQPPVTYDPGGTGGWMALADVNGDGKVDIVTSFTCNDHKDRFCTTGEVGALLGKGDGTFQAAITSNTGAGPAGMTMAVGDVNGDGKPDVVVSSDFCNCGVYSAALMLGNGDGTFQPATVVYAAGGFGVSSLALADVNGDGKLDLISVNHCLDNSCSNFDVTILLGNGDGTFQSAVSYSNGVNPSYSVQSAVGDVNGDGKLDLILINNNNSSNVASVSVLLGNGDGTFQTGVAYNLDGSNPFSVAVGDVNSDGKPDLVVSQGCIDQQCDKSGVAVLLGNGDGTFQLAGAYSGGGIGGYSVALGDFRGIGLNDAVVGNGCQQCQTREQGNVGVLINTSGVGKDFKVTASPQTLTVMAGQMANYTITVSPVDGFNQQIVFTCSGNPSGSTCAVTPSLVTLDGTNNATVTAAVVTAGASAGLSRPDGLPSGGGSGLWLAMAGGLGVGGLVSLRGKDRARRRAAAGLLCVLAIALMPACGGSSSGDGGGGTQTGTYTVVVAGTYTAGTATLMHAAKMTLVVQ